MVNSLHSGLPLWMTQSGPIQSVPPPSLISGNGFTPYVPVQPDLQAWRNTVSSSQPVGASVGVNASSMPGSSQDWSTTTAAASGTSPLTVIVDSTGIKSATRKRKCVFFDLDPHLYIENPKNAMIEEVISADMSLMESLMLMGISVHQYTKHIRFLSDKVKVFTGISLVRYDRAVIEKAELLGPSSFTYGDQDLCHAFLGLENLKPKPKPQADMQSGAKRFKRPDWRYNDARSCKNDGCSWRHECKTCKGPHVFFDCPSKK